MLSIEKARGRPATEFSNLTNKKLNPTFKTIAKTAIMVGVLVSLKAKNALKTRGIRLFAQIPKAKNPRQAAVISMEFWVNFPVLKIILQIHQILKIQVGQNIRKMII